MSDDPNDLRIRGVSGVRMSEWPRVVDSAIERLEKSRRWMHRRWDFDADDVEKYVDPDPPRRVVLALDSMVVSAEVLLSAEVERRELARRLARAEQDLKDLRAMLFRGKDGWPL